MGLVDSFFGSEAEIRDEKIKESYKQFKTALVDLIDDIHKQILLVSAEYNLNAEEEVKKEIKAVNKAVDKVKTKANVKESFDKIKNSSFWD